MTGTNSDSEDSKARHTDSEDPRERRINPVVVIAGALASISAAVVASYFGVAGTLIGTAVVSVISSLGAAIYAGLLGATAGRVQRTTVIQKVSSTVKQPRGTTGTGAQAQDAPTSNGGTARFPDGRRDDPPAQAEGAGGLPVTAPAVGGPPPGQPRAPRGSRGARGPDRRRRWLMIAAMAVVIFAIAIGAVTGIEAAIKEPLASALGVRNRGEASTSVGVAVHRASGSSASPTSGPSTSSTVAPPSGGSQPGQAPPTTQPLGPTTTPPPSTSPPTTQKPSTPTTTA
jgi:hypothetical protein